ncbi:cellular Repressor of E1A-stimulated Genes [Calliopsis andreniformis]|uniref:cellular Repressor of E1A-stimulated Genes n=1 Tax=Calliopsis andreniformis TaxID=337506 RepID=UPI003FCC8BFA
MIWRFALLVALSVFATEAKKYSQHWQDHEQWQEFEEFLEWKNARKLYEGRPREIKYEKQDSREVDRSSEKNQQAPPPIDQAALMARYIVNQADWASVGTISTRKDIESYPAVTLVSFTDGLLGNGTGVPYMYLTPLDFTAQDLAKDNRVSLLLTLAQGDYCKSKQWDPMDPRCARVLMSGKMKALRNESAELDLAKKLFFERHPKLVNMPPNHHFYFAKLKIMSIVVLDTFGGPKYVSVKDYLNPPVANVTDEFNRLFPLRLDETDSQQYQQLLNPVVRVV